MVAAFSRHETVFTVLGDAARRRGGKSLAFQLLASSAIAGSLLIAAPQWWSLAFLAGWSASYAAWGLLVRVREARATKVLMATMAALGTALAIAGIIGIGLAIYSGDAASAKVKCGRKSTDPLCQQHPPAVYGRTIP